MSFVIDSLFGKASTGPNVDINRTFKAGKSSVGGGNISIDPAVEALREESLGRARGLRDVASGLRQSTVGNRQAFIKSRLDPFKQQLAERKGELQRSLAQTGVRGTFANREMTAFDIEAAQATQNAEAQALAEALNTEAGMLQLEGSFDRFFEQVRQGAMNEEFAKLGLSASTVTNLISSAQNEAQLKNSARASNIGLLGNIAMATGMYLGK